jgi:hypothetical protein
LSITFFFRSLLPGKMLQVWWWIFLHRKLSGMEKSVNGSTNEWRHIWWVAIIIIFYCYFKRITQFTNLICLKALWIYNSLWKRIFHFRCVCMCFAWRHNFSIRKTIRSTFSDSIQRRVMGERPYSPEYRVCLLVFRALYVCLCAKELHLFAKCIYLDVTVLLVLLCCRL